MPAALGHGGRLRRSLALGALLALPWLGACGDRELASHLERGRALLNDQDYEEAHMEGLFVLLREPENEAALHLVALSLLAQNRDGEAEGYFRSLAQLSRDYALEAAALYEGKAREDFQGGELNRAARRWNIALSFNPEQGLGPYAFFMADHAYKDRDWQRAADLFGRALAAYPDSSATRDALYPYALSLNRLERWSESLDVLARLLTDFPRTRENHEAVWLYQELLIREARGAKTRMDYEGAVALLRRALRYDDNPPKTAEALLELGQCYEQLQDYKAAVACYQRIVAANRGASGRVYDSALSRLEKLEKARLQ